MTSAAKPWLAGLHPVFDRGMAAAACRLAAAAIEVSATLPARLTAKPSVSHPTDPRIRPVMPPCLINLRLTPANPKSATRARSSSDPALSSAQRSEPVMLFDDYSYLDVGEKGTDDPPEAGRIEQLSSGFESEDGFARMLPAWDATWRSAVRV